MRVKECCCGCSLKAGGIIIAVLGILGGFSYLVKSGEAQSHLTELENNCSQYINCTPELIQQMKDAITWHSIEGVLTLIIHAFLLFGVIAAKPMVVMIYIVLSVIGTVIFAASSIYTLGSIALIFLLIILPLQFYFLLVLYSLKCEIEEKESPNPNSA